MRFRLSQGSAFVSIIAMHVIAQCGIFAAWSLLPSMYGKLDELKLYTEVCKTFR